MAMAMAMENVSAISLKLSSPYLFNTAAAALDPRHLHTMSMSIPCLHLSKQCNFTRLAGLPLSHLFAPKIINKQNAGPYFQKTLCHVHGEGSGSGSGSEVSDASSSGEGVILDEQTLERDLQIAVEEENYARAAKIRDSLRFLHEDSKASVLAANARFYNAFRSGDLTAMQTLWAKRDNVCCVHPGVSGISGYDLVMGSWEFVCAEYEFPLDIQLKDVEVHIKGDVGYVTCIEMVKTKSRDWGKQFATNLFEKIDGQWLICIHHASYVDL